MAQKDVPGTKSHENGGPFRPSFSSQGHPSAPPVCATSLVDVRLGLPSRGHPSRVIRLGVIRLGVIRLGDSLQVKSTSSTLISPHTALQPTTTHSFIKYSKTAITTKTCQTNLKTIIIPNTLINAHTPYACIISKYIYTTKHGLLALQPSTHTQTHTHTNTQADTPDPNYINAKPRSFTRHSVADSSVATTSRPPDHKNYMNTTMLSLNGRFPISLSPQPLGHQTTETASTQHCYHQPGGRTFGCRLNHSATRLPKLQQHKTACSHY